MKLTRLAGATMLIVALAGCTQNSPSDPSDPGSSQEATVGDALNLGYDAGSACVPAPADSDDAVVFGDTLLRQESKEPVTISQVSLVNADQMALREASLVEMERGETVVGFRHASDTGELPTNWGQRVDARNVTLEPGRTWNLVLVVDAPDGTVATAQAARVHYRRGGENYTQDTLTEMATATSCDGVLFDE